MLQYKAKLGQNQKFIQKSHILQQITHMLQQLTYKLDKLLVMDLYPTSES